MKNQRKDAKHGIPRSLRHLISTYVLQKVVTSRERADLAYSNARVSVLQLVNLIAVRNAPVLRPHG